MQLSSRLIISLVDRTSGPARGIHAALRGLEKAGSRISRATAMAATGATGAGLYGLTAMAHKAEDFNKNIFGVGVAALADNTKKLTDATTGATKVVTDLGRVKAIMHDVSEASEDISRDLGISPGRISGIAETLAKAGFEAEKLRNATRDIAIAALTDTETPAHVLGEFGSVLETIYKPKPGEKWADFFKREMNIVMVAADETRLSLGSTMEGMRAFAAVYALMGNSDTSNAMMLMAGVKKGGNPTEIGQTLKSDLVRALIPTQEGLQVFNRLGLKRSDYTDTELMDPMRMTGNLARTFPAAEISKSYRTELNARLKEAIENDTFDETSQAIRDEIAQRANVDTSNADSKARFEQQFENAIFAGGKRFDMMKLFGDLIAKGATTADLATLFNMRRIASNQQILEGIREFGPEYMRKLDTANGTGLDTVKSLHDDSDIGRLRRFDALLEDFQIKLANSAGFENFLGAVTKMFDVFNNLSPSVIGFATSVGILGVAIAPLAVTIAAASYAVGGLVSVAARLAAVLGIGSGAAGAGAAGAGLAGFGLRNWRPNSAAAKISAQRMILGMGRGAAASGEMIAGMSGAGLAAGGLAAGKTGGKLVARFIPGLGLVLMAGGAAAAAYDHISKGDNWWDTAKGAALGAFGLDGFFGSAQAAEKPGGAGVGGAQEKGEAVKVAVSQAVEQARSIVAGVDLTAEGARIIQTLANGMRSAIPAVQSAASSAAAAAAGSALRGAYSDGAR